VESDHEAMANSPEELLFIVCIAWFAAHELDATGCHEWRIFQTFIPYYDRLSDAGAYRLFAGLHIPLFVWIIWGAQFRSFQIGFDLFLIVHIGLHWFFRNHPQYEFSTLFSRILISGVAPLSLLHLGLIVR